MTEELPWWVDPGNVAVLAQHLANEGDDAHEVAYAVSKPWKYEDEYRAALAALHEGVTQTP